jgi:hypothetical protein
VSTGDIAICHRCRGDVTQGEHGLYRCPLAPTSAAVVKPDTLIGGFVAHNAWREPRYFESQKAYERALDADGMMLKPKRVAGDRAMDPQTLENARILVSRLETLQQTVRVLDETVTVQADV